MIEWNGELIVKADLMNVFMVVIKYTELPMEIDNQTVL